MPEAIDRGGFVKRCPPVDVDFTEKTRPSRIWTLKSFDQEKPPELPIIPQHNYNAFLEDHSHDWSVRRGKLEYFSRVSNGGGWLLLEWDE